MLTDDLARDPGEVDRQGPRARPGRGRPAGTARAARRVRAARSREAAVPAAELARYPAAAPPERQRAPPAFAHAARAGPGARWPRPASAVHAPRRRESAVAHRAMPPGARGAR